jgi:hypothetical protein
MSAHGGTLPEQAVRVIAWSEAAFVDLYTRPGGAAGVAWPPYQVQYLASYLEQLGCKTILVEDHYIDRDYIDDLALFYARSFRVYPNHCRRLHFFRCAFDAERWRSLVVLSGRQEAEQELQDGYLGFSVQRPLIEVPVGRTVLTTVPREIDGKTFRAFLGIREYGVHLGGLSLSVSGLAFQQQDQGVSACATTALWSALQNVTSMERLGLPTPAQITLAASRYLIRERALPSEGLNISQMSEAIRAAGLSPLLVRSVSIEDDRAQILGYLSAGFAPILAIRGIDSGEGHAVCAVGTKMGEPPAPSATTIHYRDGAARVLGVYIHDDRLGPYASAQLYPFTRDGSIATALSIKWPGQDVEEEHSVLQALIVAVPSKLRLTVTRMRSLGLQIADAVGQLVPELDGRVVLNCRYYSGNTYKADASQFGLTDEGLYALACSVALPRYVGAIELAGPDGVLVDVLLDSTGTQAESAVLCCVQRGTAKGKMGDQVGAIAAAGLHCRLII